MYILTRQLPLRCHLWRDWAGIRTLIHHLGSRAAAAAGHRAGGGQVGRLVGIGWFDW